MGHPRLTLTVVVSFLNEEELLPQFLESLASQTKPPSELLLIDDGSSDRSPDLAAAFVQDHSYARLLRRPPRPPEQDRLATAAEFKAFTWGCRQSGIDADVVAKLDADLRLQPTHFSEVLEAMGRDPRLAIVGAFLSTQSVTGKLTRELHSDDHVHGPNKFYRRTYLANILDLPPLLGWDAVDDVMARRDGWRAKSIALSQGDSVHLRPTGLHDGRLRAFRRWGHVQYVTGAHPAKVIAGAAWFLAQRPPLLCGINYLYGWAAAGWRRTPRFEPSLLSYRRREDLQRLRAILVHRRLRRSSG